MFQDILNLSQKFISIKSTFDNPKALEEILNLALSYLTEYTIERFEYNGIKSALIYNSSLRPEKFKLILNGHLDVVPGKEYQYIPKIEDDKLYGVGSMDMKANLACLIFAFKKNAQKLSYPIALQLVTDEEVGGFNGTKYQVAQGVKADFILTSEPTNFDIVNQAKGIFQIKISTIGKTAHGAYPWRGENALWKMNAFLNTLKLKYPIPKNEVWETTVNLSKIETNNQSFNKIPDDCTIWLDIRFKPDEMEKIKKDIEEILPSDFKLEICVHESGVLTNENNQFIQLLKEITENVTNQKIKLRGANGTSDARHFAKINCPGIEFGPIGGDIGGDAEYVNISSLEKYFKIIEKFLNSIK